MNFQICREAMPQQPLKGKRAVSTVAAIAVNENNECLTGDDAQKADVDLELVQRYGYVPRAICIRARESGACPADRGDVYINRK